VKKNNQLNGRKFNLGHLLKSVTLVKILTFNNAKTNIFQQKTLIKLLSKAQNTIYGRAHNFENILASDNIVEAFATLPITDYLIMKPYWQQSFKGDADVAWPGVVSYFALSSGTTDSGSKYIPVTLEMLSAIKKAGRRQLIQIAKTDFPKDFLTKDYLFVGGSTDLEYNGNNYSGDLSGITTGNLPIWVQRFSKPEPFIKEQKVWLDKIEMMVENAPNWDIAMIAGVPAWILILFEKIIERYNLASIHDIWPNLTLYAHGGVSFKPYLKSFEKLLGKPIKYFETYLASEGFIAFQIKENSLGMRLVFKNGIYYEFVPFNKQNFSSDGNILPHAKAVGLEMVNEHIDYAILITTCSGAWRYLLGDTIRFTDIDQCEIIITGRTKHFLNFCGEHLCVENMNDAILLLSEQLNINIVEFTVKGIKSLQGFEHHWYIGSDEVANNNDIATLLDGFLCSLNDDYTTERKHALSKIKVTLLPSNIFLAWMEKEEKIGSQYKFPRVLSDEKYQDWLNFTQNKPSSTFTAV